MTVSYSCESAYKTQNVHSHIGGLRPVYYTIYLFSVNLLVRVVAFRFPHGGGRG